MLPSPHDTGFSILSARKLTALIIYPSPLPMKLPEEESNRQFSDLYRLFYIKTDSLWLVIHLTVLAFWTLHLLILSQYFLDTTLQRALRSTKHPHSYAQLSSDGSGGG